MTTAISRIRWGRIVIGGVLTEVALIAVAIPIRIVAGDAVLLYVVAPACLAAAFVFGLWTARRVDANFILHGALVGVVASLLYIALTWNQTLPMLYHLSHGLKVIGGAAGGAFAARQIRAAALSATK